MFPESTLRQRWFSPLGWLVAFSLLCWGQQATYAHYGIEGSGLSQLLWRWGTALLLVWWVQADARETKYRPCYEYSAFMFFGWPLLLPYYLLRTRGIRGVFLMGFFFMLFFAPWVVAWAVFFLTR